MKKSIFKQPHRSMPMARSIWWTNWLLGLGYVSIAILLTAFFIIQEKIMNNVKQKQGRLFAKEPSYLTWLAELNHERRTFGEPTLSDCEDAKRKYNRLVKMGFWN